MSRNGSILEAYWNNHPNIQTVDSFDLESADELGIHGNKSSTSISFPKNKNADRNNAMNGLFCM